MTWYKPMFLEADLFSVLDRGSEYVMTLVFDFKVTNNLQLLNVKFT